MQRVLCLVYGEARDESVLATAVELVAGLRGELTVATPLPPPSSAVAVPPLRCMPAAAWDRLLREDAAATLERTADRLAAWGAGGRLLLLEGCDRRSLAGEVDRRGFDVVVLGGRWCRWNHLARSLRRRTRARIVCVAGDARGRSRAHATYTGAPTGV